MNFQRKRLLCVNDDFNNFSEKYNTKHGSNRKRVCMCMHLSNSLHLALKQIFVIFQPIYIILSTFIHRYARTYMHSEINTFWYFGNFALLDQCSCKCIDDTGKRDLSNAASLFSTVLEGKLLDRLMVYFFV